MRRLTKKVGFVGCNHIYQMDKFICPAFRSKNIICIFLKRMQFKSLEAFLQTGLQHDLFGGWQFYPHLIIDKTAESIEFLVF